MPYNASKQIAWFVLTVAYCQVEGFQCDEQGSVEYDALAPCLEDDASFVQLKPASTSNDDNEKDDASLLQVPEISKFSVAKVKQNHTAAAVDDPAANSTSIWKHVAVSRARVSARYTALVGQFASSWSELRLRVALSGGVTVFLIVLIILFIVLVSLWYAMGQDGGGAKQTLERPPLSKHTLSPGASSRQSNLAAPQAYSHFNQDSAKSLAMHTSPAGSAVQSGMSPDGSRRILALAPVASPGLLHSSPRLQPPSATLETPIPRLQVSGGGGGDVILNIPIIYVDDGQLPPDGYTTQVKDQSGAERFTVKVWPNTHKPPRIGVHTNVHEYVQVFSHVPSRQPQETFLLVVCGSGKDFVCHVYLEGARMYGSISLDITFPTKDYVVGSTYTLRSSSDNRRLLTILRTQDQGLQILSLPKIIADVSEKLDSDTYEAHCHPGADVAQVVFMILGMDRLIDHTTRQAHS